MSLRESLNVTERGRADGRPMVFAHGFGCDQAMWRHVAPAFEDDYRVVLYDHAGFGGSDPRAWDRTRHAELAGYAQDLMDLLEELDLRDVVFVGHSVASMIGVLAAKAAPGRFGALVLVGPSPRYLDDEDYTGGFSPEDIEGLLEALESNYLGWSAQMAPVIVGNEDRPALGEELTASFCRTDPDVAATFARATFLSDNRADLPGVPTPALVLQCAQDAIAPQAVGEYVAAQMPRAQLVLMEATGHCPNLSHPDETIAEMKRFLARA